MFLKELNQIVVFRLGEELYGAPIEQVREIVRMSPISKIPQMSDYTEGVTNLRGAIHVVHNLRRRLGMNNKEFDSNTRIIVAEGKSIGFIVDKIDEILRINKEDISPKEQLHDLLNKKYLSSIIKHNNDIITVLDLEYITEE